MTLLIKNVRILGGKKEYKENVEVFVVGDRISAIGNFSQKSADRIVDGQGSYLTPGFIDVGSAADHYLDIFDNPTQENMLSQGVTTIVGGQCGFSLAPLLYGRLDMIRKWADTDKININWHNIKELFANLNKQKLGVNFATLTGQLTVRQEILGDSARDLTQNELAVFKKVVSDSMDDGSSGISFGLEYSHGKGTPYKELKTLAEIAAKKGGICSIHLRNHGPETIAALKEAINLAKDTKVKTIISHLLPLKEIINDYSEMLNTLSSLPENAPIYFNVRPFTEKILPAYFLLPSWAQKGSLDEMFTSLNDEWMIPRLLKEFPKIEHPEKLKVLRAVKNESLQGKSLKEFMGIYELKDQAQALRQLMISTKLRATLSYENLDSELLDRALMHPRSLLATHAPKGSDSYKSAFIQFINKAEGGLMPLEKAVQKVSTTPAKLFGFKDLGEIAEGKIADLTAFKNGEIKFTIVNGEVAYQQGEKTEKLNGRTLSFNS